MMYGIKTKFENNIIIITGMLSFEVLTIKSMNNS